MASCFLFAPDLQIVDNRSLAGYHRGRALSNRVALRVWPPVFSRLHTRRCLAAIVRQPERTPNAGMFRRGSTQMADFSLINQQPLSQTLLVALREAIISGQLKPGQPLIQARLAAQFGVSRGPLREALNRLEEEGFVKTIPYKGSAVTPLTRQNVQEIRSLRNMVEEFAGQLIIADLRQHQLDEIEAIYAQMQEAAPTAVIARPWTPWIWDCIRRSAKSQGTPC